MRIVIDNREPNVLIENLKNLCEENKNIQIETGNLDLGDILIYKNNSDIPDIMIERKSLNDLIASLKDGRYNEQSYRLDKLPMHNHNIYYIIEGSIEHNKNPITRQTIYSSILTLSYFKGFSVINSFNIKQTATIIYRFSDKLEREQQRNAYFKNGFLTTTSTPITSITNQVLDTNDTTISLQMEVDTDNNEYLEDKYSSVLKASKKSNITQDNILEIMLMQIPNVSANVAQQISHEFKTMKNLITNLENNKNCLNNLYINSSNKRKISKTTINNIINYLLNEIFAIKVEV